MAESKPSITKLKTGKKQETGPSLEALKEACTIVDSIKELCNAIKARDLLDGEDDPRKSKKWTGLVYERGFKVLKRWAFYVMGWVDDLGQVKDFPDAFGEDRRKIHNNASKWAQGIDIVWDFHLGDCQAKPKEALKEGKDSFAGQVVYRVQVNANFSTRQEAGLSERRGAAVPGPDQSSL